MSTTSISNRAGSSSLSLSQSCVCPHSARHAARPVSLKHRWHEHMIFALEAGHAHATDRLPLDVVGLNANGNFFTVQSRIGWEF